MRKKQLIEQLAALRKKRKEECDRLTLAAADVESATPVPKSEIEALLAMDKPIEDLEAEIQSLETLEAAAKRNAVAAAPPGQARQAAQAHNNAEDRPFGSFGEFLLAVVHAATPGRIADPRLLQLAASGASEGIPSDGGFLVRPEYAELLYNRGFDLSPIAPRCRDFTLGQNSDRLRIPIVNETSRATGSRWGGVRVFRANEAATVTASKPTFELLEIVAEKLMGIFYATDELLADASVIEQIASEAFTEEFAFVLDDEIINGNGANGCLGILNSAALVVVTKAAAQAVDTVVYENIAAMWGRMPPRNRFKAVWLINQEVEAALNTMTFNLAATVPVPVYLPPGGASAAPYGTLYGRPVITVEQAAALGDQGDIILADLNQYLLVKKGGLNAASSMHVRFIYDEMAFRWTMRVNGQPAWKSAVTPFKGSKTVSPFITLEPR